MLRSTAKYALLIAALLCLTGPARAESAGDRVPPPGYWDGGKWIGYVPAHLKNAQRDDRPSATATQAVPKTSATASVTGTNQRAGVSASRGDESRELRLEPLAANERAAVSASRGYAASEGRQVAVKPAATASASRERSVVRTSYEEGVPMDVEDGMVYEGESIGATSGAYCADGNCGESECDSCGPQVYREYGRVYASGEYLGWWTEGMRVPVLATTSTAGTAQAQAGVLGQASTRILFGDEGLDRDMRSGARFKLGLWLDPCRQGGVEVTYMSLAEKRDTFSGSNHDYTILARPFFNTVTGREDARLIVFPAVVEGSMAVASTTDLQGIELVWRRATRQECYARDDFLIGYRWAQLTDTLRIDESTVSLAGATAGDTIDLFDAFDTRNRFHGVELGLSSQRQLGGCWSLDLLGKVALGNVNSSVQINGQAIAVADGETSITPGGLLAQPTNMGNYDRNSLASIIELGISLRRQFDCGLEATFGYSFMYWSDVSRAGDQIDRDINTTQLPPGPLVGEPRPEFSFRNTDFWAQGLNVGLEYAF